MTIMTMTLTTILTIIMMILIREQMRELGSRESEVQRIFAGLRQAVSSKVFYQDGLLLVMVMVMVMVTVMVTVMVMVMLMKKKMRMMLKMSLMKLTPNLWRRSLPYSEG